MVASLSSPGTLIHARGRDWVVLPESTDDLLMARPVGGLDEEVIRERNVWDARCNQQTHTWSTG